MSDVKVRCRDCGIRPVEPGLDFGLGVWANTHKGFGGMQNFGRRFSIPLCTPCAEKRAEIWWERIKREAAEAGLLG